MKHFGRLFIATLALWASSTVVAAAEFDQQITALIRDFDIAKYETPNKDARTKAFAGITERADSLVKLYPGRPEALVWKGISLAEQSVIERDLGFLKQARKTLEAAIAIQPNAFSSDAQATLASMYANAPSWPLAFGDNKKARAICEQALSSNATSASVNVTYAHILFKLDDFAGAIKHATAGLNGPPRPGREKADAAVRASATSLIARTQQQLR
jgi:tetratricopeptide (TPR) repeat protein